MLVLDIDQPLTSMGHMWYGRGRMLYQVAILAYQQAADRTSQEDHKKKARLVWTHQQKALNLSRHLEH
jgi:hypothetical protein